MKISILLLNSYPKRFYLIIVSRGLEENITKRGYCEQVDEHAYQFP